MRIGSPCDRIAEQRVAHMVRFPAYSPTAAPHSRGQSARPSQVRRGLGFGQFAEDCWGLIEAADMSGVVDQVDRPFQIGPGVLYKF